MTRHVLDRPRTRSGVIFRRYSDIDTLLRATPRKQVQVLRRQPKIRDGNTRLKRYLWLERRQG